MSGKNVFRFIVVSLIAFSSSLALAQEAAKDSVKKEPAKEEVKGPKIQLAETDYDFGTAAQGTKVKHVFKFKNVGTDTLKIEQVKTSCGCTAAESSKIIPPQKDGQIDVTYNAGTQPGKVSKTVYIYSNDVEAKQRSVVIHGIVEAPKTGTDKK